MNDMAARLARQRQATLERERARRAGMSSQQTIQATDRNHAMQEPTTPTFAAAGASTSLQVGVPEGQGSPQEHINIAGEPTTPGGTVIKNEKVVPVFSSQVKESVKALTEQNLPTTFDPRSRVPAAVEPPAFDLSDVPAALHRPVPDRMTMACTIVRQKGGLLKMYPKYYLYLEDQGKETFLLSARKRSGKRSANYILSTSKDDLARDSKHFFGKVRSNFLGTEFVLYDDGYDVASTNKRKGPSMAPRQELGAVFYHKNFMGSDGPRKMQVVIPRITVEDTVTKAAFKGRTPAETILKVAKNEDRSDDLIVLHNKAPSWNEQSQAYTLNFGGRVTQASVKNFQLVSDADPNYVILQFGKVDKHKFNMDVAWPLSIAQAFAIVMSAFDNKLACE